MTKEKANFLTIFLPYKDFHFFKDPGQLPYRFQKNFNCKSKLLSFKNGDDYSVTEKHLQIEFIEKGQSSQRNRNRILWYLIRKGRKIDILNLFHIGWSNFLVAFIYKVVNPGGFVYLKLDNCFSTGPYKWEDYFSRTGKAGKESIKALLVRKLLHRSIDLYSVEDEDSKKEYENSYRIFRNKIICSYNGSAYDLAAGKTIAHKKENIILTVGRLGTYQKATEVLLEAFASIKDKNDWFLHLAGSIDPAFNDYIENYFKRFPDLSIRVVFEGVLSRSELSSLYSRARIFCLPSRFEGFAIVLAEAMHFGNAVLTTKNGSLRRIIEGGAGLVVEKDDVKALSTALQHLIVNPAITKKFGGHAGDFAAKELNWDTIVQKLHKKMLDKGLCI